MVYRWVNKETGELLTTSQMLIQGAQEYDLGDPTNPLTVEEYYIELKPPIKG